MWTPADKLNQENVEEEEEDVLLFIIKENKGFSVPTYRWMV